MVVDRQLLKGDIAVDLAKLFRFFW